jgi:hypothetical protein
MLIIDFFLLKLKIIKNLIQTYILKKFTLHYYSYLR